MLVKDKYKKVRYIGVGKGVVMAKYKRIRGDGLFDVLKGLFTGGVKLIGNLFRSSGAKQLAQKAISSGSQLAKNALKEGAQALVKDVASDPMKYVNKATELVDKLKSSENPQDVAQEEAKKFSKQILNIAKEKVVQPTIDQYRDEFEGVKDKLKSQINPLRGASDARETIQAKQDEIQNSIGNLIAGMGLHKKKQVKKQSGKGKKVEAQNKERGSNSKIMNKLRGAGLVPL